MPLNIGDVVRSLVDMDFIDRIDTSKPHEIFNFAISPDGDTMVGIKNGKYWYYVRTNEVELWK